MILVTLRKFGFFTLCFFILSCQHSANNKLNISTLVPFTATYVEGDDGLQSYSLTIEETNNIFSAREISTDNYSVSKFFDTLKLLQLNENQILKAKQFLIAASRLPSKCDQPTSLTQKLSITFENKKIEIEGNCDWNEAAYFDLRDDLFKKIK